jgi:periplasmic protein TonB
MFRSRWAGYIGGALLVNLAMLGLLPLLAQEREARKEEDFVAAISLVKLTAPALPEREDVAAKPKPEPEPQPDFMPELMQPDFSSSGSLAGDIAIDLGALSGSSGGLGQAIVFESYELDSPPEPVVKVPPVYPYQAREQGTEGVVQVRLLVRPDGSVGQVLIVAARPEGIFEEAVRQAVPRWKFEPGKVDGQAVAAWVVTAVHFKL